MSSLDSLKLNKQLLTAMSDAGFVAAKEIQSKSISRILGGQDIVGVGPEGSGKTTAYVLAVLMRLKYAQEEPPQVLILTPDKERVLAIAEKFAILGKNTNIRTAQIYPGVGLEAQREVLSEGVDVVIGTPDRVLSIYQKSGINLSKIKIFILDDADLIVKQGQHTMVQQIAESLPKCQHLVFTEVVHNKLNRLTSFFLIYPVLIEVKENSENQVDTIDQLLYQVPNYKTKLNLLNLLMREPEEYAKGVIFVNTKLTAENLYKSLERRFEGQVAILKPMFFDQKGFKSIEEFKESEEVRILLVANESQESAEFEQAGLTFILHFDLPPEKETYIQRIKKSEDWGENTLSIIFSTDIELNLVKKIEQSIGKEIAIAELPVGLIIEGNRQRPEEADEKDDLKDSEKGAAFHEKKESNAKTYNWGYKDKLKMFGRGKKRK